MLCAFKQHLKASQHGTPLGDDGGVVLTENPQRVPPVRFGAHHVHREPVQGHRRRRGLRAGGLKSIIKVFNRARLQRGNKYLPAGEPAVHRGASHPGSGGDLFQ